MRLRPAPLGSLTALGFLPALFALVYAEWLHSLFSWAWPFQLLWPGTVVMANTLANSVMLGVLALAYTMWILGVARGWITTATGGGFAIAAGAVCLRVVVEFPHGLAQVPLALMPPPEPFATTLIYGRAFGIIAYAGGLAFVLAAVLSERRLRREAPAWATPP